MPNERVYGFCRMNPGLAGEFKQTFGRPLKDFWSITTGFDLIAFDDWLKPEDNMSTADTLKTRYSGSAVVLINRLIKGS